MPPHIETRPLTIEEIHKIVGFFEASAVIVKNAGADAIEIHGHQGYLIDQFSTSLWNHRTDEYGGSLENRLRFSKEIIEAIRRGAGKDFPIIYRFGLTHYMEGGRTIEEGLEMAKLLENYGVDALDIDSGCYEQNYLPHPPTTIPCGSFADLAEKAKGVVSIPVITSTRIGYPEIAEKIINDGRADFVCLGRPLIADPQWGNKAKEGKEVRPCIACHEGCLRRLGYNKPLSCAVNPLAGNEEYLKLEPSTEKKSVCVIGGGIAGMVSAITCSKRGHAVTLYEKTNGLGGNFRKGYVPSFKNDYSRYVEYLEHELQKTTTNVLLNTAVVPNDIKNKGFDVVINAVGAHFKEINIKGLEMHPINPMDLYQKKDFLGWNLVIVGGGLVGAEAALNVAQNGGNVTVVEMTGAIAAAAQKVNQQHLLLLLKQSGVKCLTDTMVLESRNNCLICKNAQQESFEIPFNHISLCVGMEANKLDLSDFDNVITVGDADHSGIVIDAVWSAYRQCRLI